MTFPAKESSVRFELAERKVGEVLTENTKRNRSGFTGGEA